VKETGQIIIYDTIDNLGYIRKQSSTRKASLVVLKRLWRIRQFSWASSVKRGRIMVTVSDDT